MNLLMEIEMKFVESIMKFALEWIGKVRPTILWWWNLSCPIRRKWMIGQSEIDLLYAFAYRDMEHISNIPKIRYYEQMSLLFKARYIQPVTFAAMDIPRGRTIEESLALIQETRFWAWHHPTDAGMKRLLKEGKE